MMARVNAHLVFSEGKTYTTPTRMMLDIRQATSLRKLPCTVRVFCAKLLRR